MLIDPATKIKLGEMAHKFIESYILLTYFHILKMV